MAACREWLLGTALDIMRPGAGARDPGMVSPSAYIVVMPLRRRDRATPNPNSPVRV